MKFMEIIPHDTKYDFMGKSKYWIIVSVVLVAASLISIFVKGFNWGIDFAGGLELRVEFSGAAQNTTMDDVRKTMDKLPPDLPLEGVQVTRFIVKDKNVYSIKTKGEENVTRAGGDAALQDLSSKLLAFLVGKYGEGNVSIISTDMVGPRVGSTLRLNALYAILVAFAGIMLYVGLRFNFRYSPGSIIALAHDVIITAGVFSFMNREMDLVVLASLLTIAGYSINDTIVIFDRIREGQQGRYRGKPLKEAVNASINETLSRTILTSLTVFIVVLALLFLGGEVLFNFSLAMTVGCVAGVYSTLFIASPIYVGLEGLAAKMRKSRGGR